MDRTLRLEPDVPTRAVTDPRLHLRHAVDVPGRTRPRRPDVHADHLAAGHLAAAARRQLHSDAAARRPFHAAVDSRHADRRPDLRLHVRPLRRARVRDRRDDLRGRDLRAAVAAAD